MCAEAATSRPSIACLQCPYRASSEQSLAIHLVDAHGMASMPEAVDRARAIARDAAKTARHTAKKRAGVATITETPQVKEEEADMPSAECGYCHHPKTNHTPSCRRAKQSAGACSCGGISRHKPDCPRYGGTRAGRAKGKKQARRAPQVLGELDRGEARTNGHHTSAALTIARERAQEELEDARVRAVDAQADVRALERLVARLEGAA